MNKGTLYLVSTPIGNMEDITIRAINILQKVDIILAEDTRVTARLLKRHKIEYKLLKSYRDQVHSKAIQPIKEALNQGLNIALVSDAGTPTISDPGFKLVRDLKKENFKVVTIPGPSAIIAALSISGLPTDKFVFLGFLPKSTKKRKEILETYCNLNLSIILYESPHRIKRLLQLISNKIGNCQISLARELTKIHEEVLTDNISNLIKSLDSIKGKGEYTVIIHK